MKKLIQIHVILLLATSLTASDAHARGFGGGGIARGGGGGGLPGGGMASRPSPSVGRSPSISRPSTPFMNRPSPGTLPSGGARPGVGGQPGVGSRPGAGNLPGAGARPGAGNLPGAGGRPSAGDLNNFLDIRPSTGDIGGAGSRPAGSNLGAGGAAAQFLQQGVATGRPVAGQLPAGERRLGSGVGDNRADVAGNRTERVEARSGAVSDRMANRPSRVENRQQLQDNRFERRDEVRDQVLDNHPRLDFWSDYPNWAAWRINRPYRWATWAAITGWVGYGWSEQASYSYGDNVYYEGDTVYYGDQAVATTEEYAQQAESIAASAPEVPVEQAEWMPLGVFALTPDGQANGPDPSIFLQLAISKEGVISGTLHNTATQSTQTIEGAADKGSQRCAWNVVGKTRPIMETGISNLTQDTAPALVHFDDGQTQQVLMVRLEEPKDQQ